MPSFQRAPLAALACCAAISGCAAPAGETEPSSGDPAWLIPREGRAMLTVIRDAAPASAGCQLAVLVDGQEAGALASQGWITMYPPPGLHTVSLRPASGACAPGGELRTALDADRHLRLWAVREPAGTWRLREADAR